MKKVFIFLFALILFISCKNGVVLDNACFCSDKAVFIGTKEFPKQKTENIVVDRYSYKIWRMKNTERKIFMRDINETEVSKVLDFDDGNLNYLYENYLFNEKYISRAVINNTQKLVLFDINTKVYQTIEIDLSQLNRICGLDDNYIYLYIYDNSIIKINYITFEKEIINFDLWNPGYCVESECFIGINENNNICIIKNGIQKELPVKGIRYRNKSTYIDISNLYYCIDNKIYYAKKDILGYMKSIFNFTFFLDGLGPVKWYCYDMNTNISKKINNKGYSFISEFNVNTSF